MKTATQPKTSGPTTGGAVMTRNHSLAWTALLLFLVLSALFYESYDTKKVLFSNDGPLGSMVADQNRMPQTFDGVWNDLNWLGTEGISPAPAVTTFMRLFMSPFTYGRILAPASLFIAGFGACFCFRRYKLAPIACILGGLAAGLNSDFLSTSCWGVATQTVGFGAMFVALGLLADSGSRKGWVKVVLAGLAVGIGVMEAYDIGALFSLFIAAFVIYQALFMNEGTVPEKFGKGVARLTLVAVFAGFIAAQALVGLIGTQIQGVTGAKQDAKTREAMWPMMTEWSLPKAETLQVIIPGVFGYRNPWHMYDDDQPLADQYWGIIGEDPNIGMVTEMLKNPNPDAQAQAANYLKNPNLLWRLIGTGFYVGVPVVVIALWAMFQAFRGEGSPFTKTQRRVVQFWMGAAVVSLLLSFGKYAPFYQLFYALPYASAIRNPDKFMHVFTWALLIVFGFGVHGMAVAYLQNSVERAEGLLARFKHWLTKASGFERAWFGGSIAAIIISLLSWAIYAKNAPQIQAYVQTVGIVPNTPEMAASIAAFSIHAVGVFVVLLLVTIALLTLISSGQFAGSRARWAGWLLGALLVFDLGRAGLPWIIYQDVPYKYANDPVMQLLADKPYEHRVAEIPVGGGPQVSLLQNAYGSFWKQGLFEYYNIQCADVIQEPRVSEDKQIFSDALPQNSFFNVVRFWELSNTRYILGPGGDFVSKQLDPSGKLFHVVMPFEFVPKRPDPVTPVDFSAQPKTNGELAVIEFMGALPRAKLFANWSVGADDTNTLQQLASPSFDPHQSVLVADRDAPAPPASNAGQNPGSVEITKYLPKHIQLSADVKVPSVLLLTERYSPKWRVTVDGKPAPALRCDFILRGVYLQPGKHTIEFDFAPSRKALYVSLSAIVIGLALIGWLALTGDGAEPARKEN